MNAPHIAKPWNGKRRTQAAMNREPADRVPIDYSANPGIDAALKAHFGLAATDHEGLAKALAVDFRNVSPAYIGPPLHTPPKDRRTNIWGAVMRYVEHPAGGYWDYCDWPLQDADLAAIERFPLPSPDDFDIDGAIERARAYQDYYLLVGGPGDGDIINSTGMVRTMEQVLVDLLLDQPESAAYYRRKTAIQLAVLDRLLDKGRGLIDMLFIGEDLGTQIGPLISLDLYRERLKPIHRQFAELAAAYGLPTMIHSCGSSSWAFEDFLDIGIGAVDTLQPEAANMAPAELKARFGDRLAFHGCISTTGDLAFGSVADVQRVVAETLRVMMPGGGYCASPTHMIQDNSPLENVLAMYDTIQRHGWFSV